jgi:DNA-binding HxlR family transcriptional regulator
MKKKPVSHPGKKPRALRSSISRYHEQKMNDPELNKLVMDLIGLKTEKWTMAIIEALDEKGVVRFNQLSKLVPDISQKMLTQTVRQIERDGLLTRKIYPVIPPKVEYELTPMGQSLSDAFCAVWEWTVKHRAEIELARKTFDEKFGKSSPTANSRP